MHAPPAAQQRQCPISMSQSLADLMRFMTIVAAGACTAAVAAPEPGLPWPLPFAAFLLWVITSTAVFFLPRWRHGRCS